MFRWLLPGTLFLFSFAFIWFYTLGFSAFTMFSYVLKRAGEPPYPLPDLNLECHDGSTLNLRSLDSRPVFLNFIYLHCLYGCPISLAKMYLIKKKVENTLLVSVSVDPDRDTIGKLRERWEAIGGYPNWLFCKPTDKNWREKLERIGVWVYRREDGLINHTLDIFIVKEGKIIDTIPPSAKRLEIYLGGKEDEITSNGR